MKLCRVILLLLLLVVLCHSLSVPKLFSLTESKEDWLEQFYQHGVLERNGKNGARITSGPRQRTNDPKKGKSTTTPKRTTTVRKPKTTTTEKILSTESTSSTSTLQSTSTPDSTLTTPTASTQNGTKDTTSIASTTSPMTPGKITPTSETAQRKETKPTAFSKFPEISSKCLPPLCADPNGPGNSAAEPFPRGAIAAIICVMLLALSSVGFVIYRYHVHLRKMTRRRISEFENRQVSIESNPGAVNNPIYSTREELLDLRIENLKRSSK